MPVFSKEAWERIEGFENDADFSLFLRGMAQVYRETGRTEEADRLDNRADEVDSKLD
ncbi:hypothetical protein OAC89_06920 [Deltaproteobacteria bacterium]|nr:hypothetical protein [Deltaproteobacteria bacterium]